MIADALTKVVRLAARRAPGILRQLGARALIIDRRGVRYTTQSINSGGATIVRPGNEWPLALAQ
jgi:hypothetical protein